MTAKEIVQALARLRVETGSLACLGCGSEHNCSTQGCAILRTAADLIERLTAENAALREKQMEVRILDGKTAFELELRVNEFLARTPYRVVDIEFSTSAVKAFGGTEGCVEPAIGDSEFDYTAVGLNLAKELVKKHKGKLEADHA